MNDKSPRQHMSKKNVKSIKEKRRDKKARGGKSDELESLMAEKGHHRSH